MARIRQGKRRIPRRGDNGLVKAISLITLCLSVLLLLGNDNGKVYEDYKLLDKVTEAISDQMWMSQTTTTKDDVSSIVKLDKDTTAVVTASQSPLQQEEDTVIPATTATTTTTTTTSTIPTNATRINVAFDKNYKSPEWIYGPGVTVKIEPSHGTHRPEADAVFCFSKYPTLPLLVRFVSSLLHTGYTGDIVIAIYPEMADDVRDFIDYYTTAQQFHLVVYTVELTCQEMQRRTRCIVENMFWSKNTYLVDSRPHREKAQLRFELYWAWSLSYSADSRIFLLDARDVYFQSNPFVLLDTRMNTSLHVFEEWGGRTIQEDRLNSLWVRSARGKEWLATIGDQHVINSGTTVGGKPAIEMYLRAMVAQWDDTLCTIYGCYQGHVNFLIHGDFLQGAPNLTKVVIHPQGTGVANSVGAMALYAGGSLREQGVVDNVTNAILNNDGRPSPVIHQFDLDEEMHLVFMIQRTNELLLEWNNTLMESRQQQK